MCKNLPPGKQAVASYFDKFSTEFKVWVIAVKDYETKIRTKLSKEKGEWEEYIDGDKIKSIADIPEGTKTEFFRLAAILFGLQMTSKRSTAMVYTQQRRRENRKWLPSSLQKI